MSNSITYLESIFLQGVKFQKKLGFKKLWRLQNISRYAASAWLRRRKMQRHKEFPIPTAIAISPTMRCNLSCIGCYAKDYPKDGELSLDIIDKILTDAENMGVFVFIVTGGEPLMKEGILELFQKHKRLLFLIITNGTLLDSQKAQIMYKAGNIVPVVSLEGTEEQTSYRRGDLVYYNVKRAMRLLDESGVMFGFSAMVTSMNFNILVSDKFIDDSINRGCSVGFYTEYIPIGSAANWSLVLNREQKEHFREKVLEIRKNKPIMLAHLPDDEYGKDGKCLAVMSGCVHINSQGYVEPCPFSHIASDNIKDKGLEESLKSSFLRQIRNSEATMRRGEYGCALFENRHLVEDIAFRTGAVSTEKIMNIKEFTAI
ncbi:radical SAM protein [Candidatus Poribacteria bacterium]|nr:radical SAM protein [Candidatus Poribacteria bacterium]